MAQVVVFRSLYRDQADMSTYSIQMPDVVELEETTETYGRFVIQPLERGFGVTIGNALRRVLLSSLQGVAYGCNYEQLVEGDCPLSI